MHVAVIGAGNIGGTLGRGWAQAGHDVTFGVRDPDSPQLATRLEAAPTATSSPIVEAARGADAVLLAVPGAALDNVLTDLAPHAAETVIIDATNNMAGGPMNGVSAITAALPGADVFRAFNTLGWENFATPTFAGVPADLFYCGPEGDADTLVESLIAAIGLRPMRVGDLDQVDVVDSVTRLYFALARTRGRHLAFSVLQD